jgi:acyl-CoA synthetase (AMP-forming)/AMP-acid ligase II
VAGTMPKTSSGKLQRSLCKQRYLDEDLQLA